MADVLADLDVLEAKANFGKLRAFPSGDIGRGAGKTYEHVGAVGNGPRAALVALAVNHLRRQVVALKTGPCWFTPLATTPWIYNFFRCNNDPGCGRCQTLTILVADLAKLKEAL